jgi:hypothetical protein
VATGIDDCHRAVQRAFENALTIARGATTKPLHDVETSMWTAVLALGRAMIALYLARVVARPRTTGYVHDGAKFVLTETVSTEIGTRFGKVVFERPVGRRVGWRRASSDRPIDRALGLCSGFSLSTVLSVTRLCAQLAETCIDWIHIVEEAVAAGRCLHPRGRRHSRHGSPSVVVTSGVPAVPTR